jgi:hypothetical protein
MLKKNSLGPISIYIPAANPDDWTRSQHIHCPPLSASTSSSSSLANAVDCGPVKQEFNDYNADIQQQPIHPVLSHSQSLPQMHLTRYSHQRNPSSYDHSPYASAVPSPYHSPQQHPVNANPSYRVQDSYNSPSTTAPPSEISPIDSPLLSPFVPNDQYSAPGYASHSSYHSFSLPMNILHSYSYNSAAAGPEQMVQYRPAQEDNRVAQNLHYDYAMEYKHPEPTQQQQHEEPEQPEQVCDPQFVSGHEVGGGIDLVAQEAQVEEDVDAEGDSEADEPEHTRTSTTRASRKHSSHSSSASVASDATSGYSSPPPHVSSAAAAVPIPAHIQYCEEEEEEEESDESEEYDYDDQRDGDYVYRDRDRSRSRSAALRNRHHHQQQHQQLDYEPTMDDMMEINEVQDGATASSGRPRSSTEHGPYGNFYDWDNSPYNTSPMGRMNVNLSGSTTLLGMRTRAGTTVGYSNHITTIRYSPYPQPSHHYDEYSHVMITRPRRGSYSSEENSSGGGGGHPHPPLTPSTPLTPGTPLSPSIGSSSSYSSLTHTSLTHTLPAPPLLLDTPGLSGIGIRRRSRASNSLPTPIPVPNLTKKSRGRRVPTVTSLEGGARKVHSVASSVHSEYTPTPTPTSSGGAAAAATATATGGGGGGGGRGGKGARIHTCKVPGCGKCFARGEHLKRHIRSIHTYDKPHKCPYPGCGKDFSRHDNLGQHMRVHKDYRPTR